MYTRCSNGVQLTCYMILRDPVIIDAIPFLLSSCFNRCLFLGNRSATLTIKQSLSHPPSTHTNNPYHTPPPHIRTILITPLPPHIQTILITPLPLHIRTILITPLPPHIQTILITLLLHTYKQSSSHPSLHTYKQSLSHPSLHTSLPYPPKCGVDIVYHKHQQTQS